MRTILVAVALAMVACSEAEPQRDYSTLSAEELLDARQQFQDGFFMDWWASHDYAAPHCTVAGAWIDERADVRFDTMGAASHDGLFAELCEQHLTAEQQLCVATRADRDDIECCLRGTPLEHPDGYNEDVVCVQGKR